jgi:plastocyanin
MAFGLLAIICVVSLIGCSSGGTSDETQSSESIRTTSPSTQKSSAPASSSGSLTKVVNRDPGGSGKYEFYPSNFTFNVGQEVKFELSSETEFHTFTVDDLDIDLGLEAEEIVEFTFTFNDAGTYDLVCLSHPEMTGKIVVK